MWTVVHSSLVWVFADLYGHAIDMRWTFCKAKRNQALLFIKIYSGKKATTVLFLWLLLSLIYD